MWNAGPRALPGNAVCAGDLEVGSAAVQREKYLAVGEYVIVYCFENHDALILRGAWATRQLEALCGIENAHLAHQAFPTPL